MRDEQHCLAITLPNVQQIILQPRSRVSIERAERLVHQQTLRRVSQRSSQCHALLHAAGQLLGIEILVALEPDHFDKSSALRFRLGGGHALLARAIHHIAQHGLPRKQRELLEYRTAIRPWSRDYPSPDLCRAAGWADEAADNVEQCRLAAAGRTKDRDEGSLLDRQRDVR